MSGICLPQGRGKKKVGETAIFLKGVARSCSSQFRNESTKLQGPLTGQWRSFPRQSRRSQSHHWQRTNSKILSEKAWYYEINPVLIVTTRGWRAGSVVGRTGCSSKEQFWFPASKGCSHQSLTPALSDGTSVAVRLLHSYRTHTLMQAHTHSHKLKSYFAR